MFKLSLQRQNILAGFERSSLAMLRCSARSTQTVHQATQTVHPKARTSSMTTQISEWVESHGGVVHPALEICHVPEKGLGVVASRDIAADQSTPLLQVPGDLCLSASRAKHTLSKVGVDFDVMDEDVKLVIARTKGAFDIACVLAHERSLGDSSSWAPYIACLPSQPPCAWLLQEDDLKAELEALSIKDRDAFNLCRYVGKLHETVAGHLADTWPQLQGSAEDILWALGHVTSRAKVLTNRELMLVPILDSMNHCANAPSPLAEDTATTQSVSGFCMFAELYPTPLRAGDELLINYANMRGMHALEPSQRALTCFMAYGFVPQELTLSA